MTMSKIVEKTKEELRLMIPATIYFLMALVIVTWVRELMIAGTGQSLGQSASMLIAALVLAKAVLIADLLPFMRRESTKPLVWIIAIKSSMYLVVATAVHLLERAIECWRHAPDFSAAWDEVLHQISWTQFLALHIVLALFMIAYSTMRELTHVLGAAKMKALMFGPRPPADTLRA
ncbi:MAG: hypothetical protein U0625_13320 [Phycisphaerales bacterium]